MRHIRLIKKKATSTEIKEMLEALDSYVKLAVDIEREIVAGGGALHADCEIEKIVKKRLGYDGS